MLSYLKSEVPALKQSLLDGKVNGSQYEGDCACLIGSLAISSKNTTNNICSIIPYYTMGLHNLGEQLFFQIKEGDTPETQYRQPV